jgi:hypothetical protein
MVEGLFLGLPKESVRYASELNDIPKCIKDYEAVAAILRKSTDVDGYYRFAQAAGLLKKLEQVPMGIDTDEVALKGWLQSEEICRQTNAKLWDLANHPITQSDDDELKQYLFGIRREMKDLLGPEPPSLEDVLHFGKFGPGATLNRKVQHGLDPILKTIDPTALRGLESDVVALFQQTKLGKCVSISSGIPDSPYGQIQHRYDAGVLLDRTDFFSHAKLAIVPKNCFTGRTVEVGGSLTTWLQQCYDGFIRQRLREKWELDLQDQRPNQALAYHGSLALSNLRGFGKTVEEKQARRPCTIDLTDASNRNSYGLFAWTLPRLWMRRLSSLTNREVEINLKGKKTIKLEKFSAMGNSITFSLMTALYGCLVRSILQEREMPKGEWRVYGDDIIVPSCVYEEVVHALRLIGSEPNTAKSFREGYFRESCGVDYLLGSYVRPLFIKKPILNVADVYKYLNLIQVQNQLCPLRAEVWAPLYRYLRSLIPTHLMTYGPVSEYLNAYIWIPESHANTISRLPRVILAEREIKEQPSEGWSYLRTLLVESSEDSHIRAGRKTQNGEGEVAPREVECTGSHAGLATDRREWQWVRSPRLWRGSLATPKRGVNPFA